MLLTRPSLAWKYCLLTAVALCLLVWIVTKTTPVRPHLETIDTWAKALNDELAEHLKIPAEHIETPAGHVDTPAELVETPAEHEEPPAEHDEPPAEHDEPPAEHDESPAEHDEPPAEHDESPAEHDESPAEHDEPPAEHVEPPAEHVKTSSSNPYSNSKFNGEGLESFKKPEGLRVVAVIFAGRREFVSILECYLRRNLVSNGGILDEVLWMIRTSKHSDINYLEDLITTQPEYTRHFLPLGKERAYRNAYKVCEKGVMYIKIDDDVVFWEDHTIAAIVKRKLENPQYAVVSANVINQPALAWVHYHLGAQHAYMPELRPPHGFNQNEATRPLPDWRASKLPRWKGNKHMVVNMHTRAPFKGHRWLPLGPSAEMARTPLGVLGMGKSFEYAPNGTSFRSWALAAQTHYSFFENLENNELWRYKFDLWDYHYDRLSINFLAFMGDDIVRHPVRGSDEQYLSVSLPKKLRKHAVLDGTGLAVHFGFHRQVYGHGGVKGWALNHTDALDRYRSYANEFICGKPMREGFQT